MKSSARLDHLSPTPSSPSGFTLIELLLAIAIIGILAAVALPGLNGVYTRQVLINSANEVVSVIKQTQNMAMSNNQQPYDRPPYITTATDVSSDCSASRPYISQYEFRIFNSTTYRIQRVHKNTNDSGAACMTPATNTSLSAIVGDAYKLPNGVQFAAYTSNWVRYDTSTSKITTASASPIGNQRASLRLTHANINPSTLSYYVCIESGRAYAQTTPCFE